MLTINQIYSTSLEIKKSTFIAYLAPFEKFENTIKNLKIEHKKSRHIVWAYRHLNEFNQVVENSTDDGEPKNSSGKPTLKVIQGHNMINSVIFTVRYFGGIKLGIGGLVRAYTDAAAQVIKTATFIDLSNMHSDNIDIYYPHIKHAEHIISNAGLSIINKEFHADTSNYTMQGNEEALKEAIIQIMKFNRSK